MGVDLRQGISWPSEQLLASEMGVSHIELVNSYWKITFAIQRYSVKVYFDFRSQNYFLKLYTPY